MLTVLPAAAAPSDLVREWLRLEPGLLEYHGLLAELVDVATGCCQPGEVAAFLGYRAVGGSVSGGAAVKGIVRTAAVAVGLFGVSGYGAARLLLPERLRYFPIAYEARRLDRDKARLRKVIDLRPM